MEHNNEELRNTNGCYLVTQFSSNPTNRFILSELSFLAKVTEYSSSFANRILNDFMDDDKFYLFPDKNYLLEMFV
ncbi:MAG: hypothetical protein IJE43_23335 [Alphaproteobacteria bacterium]|nr:hypothetical protein [Alphaproteobacteria bacterium]